MPLFRHTARLVSTKELEHAACVMCGKDESDGVELEQIGAGACRDLMVCIGCRLIHDPKVIANEAERVFAIARPERLAPRCRHCGTAVMVNPDGRTAPLVCTACEIERRAIARAAQQPLVRD